MIIDCHQHFWRYDPVRDSWIDESMSVLKADFLPQDLEPILLANGIDQCIAVQADPSENETRFLLELSDKHDFIAGVVGWVDLCGPDVVDRLAYHSKHPKLKGIRHIVQAETDPTFMQRSDFQNGIAHLAQHQLVYDILIRESQLESAIKLVEAFPDQIFVLDHLAKPQIHEGVQERWSSGITALGNLPNVYAKLSGLVTENLNRSIDPIAYEPFIELAYRAFGPERLLYGSDWPVCTLNASYTEVKAIAAYFINQLDLSEQELIYYQNAKRCYQL